MKKYLYLAIVIALVLGVIIYFRSTMPVEAPAVVISTDKPEPVKQYVSDAELSAITAKSDLILVSKPVTGTEVTAPLNVNGIARGYWYFEGSFPLVVTDWDGRIIGESYATAAGDWMTEGFVPFSGTINYELPTDETNRRGTLILKKDNPSGLPENDDAIEIPIILN